MPQPAAPMVRWRLTVRAWPFRHFWGKSGWGTARALSCTFPAGLPGNIAQVKQMLCFPQFPDLSHVSGLGRKAKTSTWASEYGTIRDPTPQGTEVLADPLKGFHGGFSYMEPSQPPCWFQHFPFSCLYSFMGSTEVKV